MLLDLEAIGPGEVRALSTLNDSKQHTEAAREALYPVVMRLAARSVIVSRCAPGIDARGLHRTNLDALRDALRSVCAGQPGEVLCLVDGFRVAPFEHEQRAITQGDATSAAIAAASILAKVSRDRFMHRAETHHPGWEFAAHVGYSTPAHRAAIARQGVSPLHRRSFASVAYSVSEGPLEVLERLEPIPGADHDADGVEA